jgi:hypothetical protein
MKLKEIIPLASTVQKHKDNNLHIKLLFNMAAICREGFKGRVTQVATDGQSATLSYSLLTHSIHTYVHT